MDLFKKVWSPLPVMILLFSIFDFLTTTFFQDLLHAPLFFDTIFMIAALFLFGPVAAFLEYIVFIYFVSAKLLFLYGTTDYVYVYSLSALSIIFVTWLFSRHKENLKRGVNFVFMYIFFGFAARGLRMLRCLRHHQLLHLQHERKGLDFRPDYIRFQRRAVQPPHFGNFWPHSCDCSGQGNHHVRRLRNLQAVYPFVAWGGHRC